MNQVGFKCYICNIVGWLLHNIKFTEGIWNVPRNTARRTSLNFTLFLVCVKDVNGTQMSAAYLLQLLHLDWTM